MQVLNLYLVLGLQVLFCIESNCNELSTGTCTFARSTTSSYTTYYTSYYTVQQHSTYGCGFLWLSRCSRYHTRYVYQILSTATYYITYYTHTDCCTGYSRINGVCTPQCTQGCVYGTCTSPGTCACNSGWTGSNCYSDINECSISNGGCDHDCTNSLGSFTCSCYNGFYLSSNQRNCIDIPECTNGDVVIGGNETSFIGVGWCQQRCINTLGGYECGCYPGYSLDTNNQTCTDIDECATNNGGCNQMCNNSIGWYNCSCYDGYVLLEDDHTCADHCDCCSEVHNDCEQICTDIEGSYNCSCFNGFRVSSDNSSKCEDINECAENKYNCTEICINIIGSYNCSCFEGYNLLSDGYTCPIPPTIKQLSSEIIALVNSSVTIAFSIIDAYPAVITRNILWKFKPSGSISDTYYIQDGNGSYFSNDRLSLTISSAQLSHTGIYSIIATNEADSREATMTLNVYVQAVLLNDSGIRIGKQKGENMTIQCTADGIPQPTILWRRNGQLLVGTSRLIIRSIGGLGFRPISGIMQTTSTLIVNDLRGSDNGTYTCRADNAANIGAYMEFPFILEVTEPPPTNYCAVTPCLNNGNCTNLKNTFHCSCINEFTGFTCAEKVITPYPPAIVEGPLNTPAYLYSSISLTCIVTGVPTPLITWYKDDQLIANENNDLGVLVISEITLKDRGFYHCQAMNMINGAANTAISSKALVNITDVAQYTTNIRLPDNFYDDISNDSVDAEIENKLRDLIAESNNYLAGSGVSNVSNASFFFLEILNPNSIDFTDKLELLPIVVTIVTERISDEQIKLGITQQLVVFSQQLSVDISVLQVNRFDGCHIGNTIIPSHSGRKELDLTITWPEMNIGETSVVNCPCGSNDGSDGSTGNGVRLTASRYCGGDFTNGAEWDIPKHSSCDFSDLAREICRLRNLPVTEKVEQLEDLTSNVTMLGSTEVTASVFILTTATKQVAGNITLTTTYFGVIDNILQVDASILQQSQQKSNTSAKVLEAIESVAEDIPVENASEPVVIAQRSFAVSVQLFNNDSNGISFNVNAASNTSGLLNAEDFELGESSELPLIGSISLPEELLDSLTNSTKITNAVFTTDYLFLRRDNGNLEVGSVVIAGTVVGAGKITGLETPVILNFQIPSTSSNISSFCTFWDQTLDDGYGNWSTEGCNTTSFNSSVMCECNHLTNFAILLDVSPAINPPTTFSVVLEAVTYMGLIVSIVCLTITIVSYLATKKLRTAVHGQLLLNLCFALMGLYITFIIALHSKDSRGFCAFAGVLLQYFFLVTFAAMAAEAINLYMTLVIVLGAKIPYYVLKAVIVCWVVPFIIVIFCFAPNYENYIRSHFCRAFEAPFYIGTVIPFIIIYIFNWVVFAIIIFTLICKQFSSKVKDLKSDKEMTAAKFVKQQLIIVLTLSFLFGLGWGVGLFATQGIPSQIVRDIIAAIFILTTAFHGVFIFIFQCLRSKDIQILWKRWFFSIIRKDFDELTSSIYNRVKYTSSGGDTLRTSIPSSSCLSPTIPKTKETAFTSGVEMKGAGDVSTLRHYVQKKENQFEPVVEKKFDPIIEQNESEDIYESVETAAVENQCKSENIYESVKTAAVENQYESEDIYESVVIENPGVLSTKEGQDDSLKKMSLEAIESEYDVAIFENAGEQHVYESVQSIRRVIGTVVVRSSPTNDGNEKIYL